MLKPFLSKKNVITNKQEQVIFGTINYTECESNWDRNKTLSIKEYLGKTKPHLKDISKTVTHRKFN